MSRGLRVSCFAFAFWPLESGVDSHLELEDSDELVRAMVMTLQGVGTLLRKLLDDLFLFL